MVQAEEDAGEPLKVQPVSGKVGLGGHLQGSWLPAAGSAGGSGQGEEMCAKSLESVPGQRRLALSPTGGAESWSGHGHLAHTPSQEDSV